MFHYERDHHPLRPLHPDTLGGALVNLLGFRRVPRRPFADRVGTVVADAKGSVALLAVCQFLHWHRCQGRKNPPYCYQAVESRTQTTTARTMASFAITSDLNWKVSKKPLFFIDNNNQPVEITDKFAVVREDTGAFLGSVSQSFEVVQNQELLKLIQPLVDEGVLSVENMGYLNKGARVFAQAKIAEGFQVLGEDYKAFVTLTNGHAGQCACSLGLSIQKIICGNTFVAAQKDLGERYRHTEGVNDRVLSSTFVTDYVGGSMNTYAQYMEKLATAQCSSDQFRAYLETVYQKETKDMRTSFVDTLNHLFYSGAGNSGKTFRDAFSACTDYSSNRSRKTETGRFFYTHYGQGARSNVRALGVALEMAAV